MTYCIVLATCCTRRRYTELTCKQMMHNAIHVTLFFCQGNSMTKFSLKLMYHLVRFINSILRA